MAVALTCHLQAGEPLKLLQVAGERHQRTRLVLGRVGRRIAISSQVRLQENERGLVQSMLNTHTGLGDGEGSAAKL